MLAGHDEIARRVRLSSHRSRDADTAAEGGADDAGEVFGGGTSAAAPGEVTPDTGGTAQDAVKVA